jgi:hypothetical protein
MPSLRHLENLFRLLLPPASREHVLGDLHEKCKSRRQYVAEALSVLGPVIVGRIRRTTDFGVFLMETLAVYLSFSAAAWWLGQKTFLYDHSGFARLVIPTTIAAIGLLISNAYADPGRQSFFIKPILQSAGSLSVAFLGQAVLFDTHPNFAVPFGIMLYGSCTSLVLVSTLRMFFPPILNGWSKIALLNEPRVSRKSKLVPRTMILPQAPVRLKTAITIAAVLLVAALLTSNMWHATAPAIKPRFAIFAVVVLLAIYQIRTKE